MSSQEIQKVITLSNGQKMPAFGLGSSRVQSVEEVTNLIRKALDVGYRHIDTAQMYENEQFIGAALKTIFGEGKYKREDIFLVTKQASIKGVSCLEIMKEQLQKLQVDYVDLLLIHVPLAAPSDDYQQWNHKPVHQIWAEFEEIHSLGLAKGLGVSNFNCQMIIDLLAYCKIKPLVNQIELHVFNQQKNLVEFLKKVNIYPVAFSPMAKYNEVVKNETLNQIAQKQNASVAQVMIAFMYHQDVVVIPRTAKIERLQHNFDAQKLQFSEEDIQTLRNLNSNTRVVNYYSYPALFKGIPFYE
ncbi:aldo/keto reductase family oxidoreductase (macronuclear) [Tetrahymena thermophila SB210]|uniref:Aldo/keto reductase family oxidoreductase n=1 Tax=Tetrahymena thermophila (strain SB210) TaxID=312017 RepID=I7M4P8_TETTS|nr:aldo/keto reductase family oxidoreductase [Tetrahymena thermophila SB210]EAS07803.1 aldo/keto reductase family oxidoreductase [Tetrahymena thermophila SB210]|eukprot:XP_001028045.1 aldo/keto reductase family oxidoreductase [Tetrahymena thermophila SB210]